MMTEYRADWYPDPAQRFELRYHNGTSWTADVASAGERYIDPLHGPRPAGPQPDGPRGRNGFGIAGLVFGIVAIATAWLPYVFVFGLIAAVLALVFGLIGMRRARSEQLQGGAALAAVVTGGVGVAAAVVGLFFTIALADALDRYDNPGPNEVSISACTVEDATWTASGSITNLDDEAHGYSVEVSFVRSGTDNAQRTSVIDIDELEPGATTQFTTARSTVIDDIDCVVSAVHGPAPFGIAID